MRKKSIKEGKRIDDSSLRYIIKQAAAERKLLGIQVEERPFDPQAIAEAWKRERGRPTPQPTAAQRQVVCHLIFLYRPAPNGEGVLAYCPAVPDHYARGATREEAKANLIAHLSRHLAARAAAGEPLPKEDGQMERVKVRVAVR